MEENYSDSKSNSPVLSLLFLSSSSKLSPVYTDDLLWFSVYGKGKWNQFVCTNMELYSTVQPEDTVYRRVLQ